MVEAVIGCVDGYYQYSNIMIVSRQYLLDISCIMIVANSLIMRKVRMLSDCKIDIIILINTLYHLPGVVS